MRNGPEPRLSAREQQQEEEEEEEEDMQSQVTAAAMLSRLPPLQVHPIRRPVLLSSAPAKWTTSNR